MTQTAYFVIPAQAVKGNLVRNRGDEVTIEGLQLNKSKLSTGVLDQRPKEAAGKEKQLRKAMPK